MSARRKKADDGAAIAAALSSITTTLYDLPESARYAVVRAICEIVPPFEVEETFSDKIAASEPLWRPLIAFMENFRTPDIIERRPHREAPILKALLLAVEKVTVDEEYPAAVAALVDELQKRDEWGPYCSSLRAAAATGEAPPVLAALRQLFDAHDFACTDRALSAIERYFSVFRGLLRPVRPV